MCRSWATTWTDRGLPGTLLCGVTRAERPGALSPARLLSTTVTT
jgi:hypothetical protein